MPTIFPSERTFFTDPSTGAEIIQWTDGPATDQHLYFTSPSVTADGRWLVFISNRTGSPNLFAIDRADGIIRRLSNNEAGILRSYVYPAGGMRGLGKASPCLDPVRNRLFFIRDDTLFLVGLDDLHAGEQKVCDLPPQWCGAFTHLSPDGRTFCFPCTDPRGFVDPVDTQWQQMRKVPDRMERENLFTHIHLIDVETGERRIAAEVPFWVTHVQFDPAGTGRILFNREGFAAGTGHPPHNRIWCLEPEGGFRPLSPEPNGEWRSHENWAPDGKSILYHGSRDGMAFVAARAWDGTLVRETRMDGIEVYHATGLPDGRRLLVDRPDGFISVIDPDAGENRIANICRHDTTIEDQDAHAHPIASPDGRSLVFTSIRSGSCNVYETAMPV